MKGDHKEDSATPTREENKDNQTEEMEDEQTKEQEKDVENQEQEITEDQPDQEEDTERTEEQEKDPDEMIEELQVKIEQLTKEKEELYDRMLRIQAEYENYKRRTMRERAADRKYKSQELASELLPALDNFERALAVKETEENKSLIEGITMVYEQILEAFKSEGIESIETVGKEFDPNLHHAVMQVEEEDKPSNIIVEELQKGYILNDRVIRAAMVKVNK